MPVVSPTGGFTHDGSIDLVHSVAILLGGRDGCQRPIVAEEAMDQIGEVQAVFGISRESAVDIGRALAHIVAAFQRVFGVPGVEAPLAIGDVVMRGVPVLVRQSWLPVYQLASR